MESRQRKLMQFQTIIQKGFALLQAEKAYRQVNILKKLKTLDLEVSPTSFSNILKGKIMGYDVLNKAATGINQIIETELGLIFQESGEHFIPHTTPENGKHEIEEYDANKLGKNKAIIFRSEGRLSISNKVAFLETAQREIIEMGVRLNTFSNHFFSRNEKEFALPIKNLLDRGVNIKIYLLNPDYNGAHLYFSDRALALEEEGQSVEQIKTVIRKLKKIYDNFELGHHVGKFEIFTYRHIPYNQFLIIDGNSPRGKMIVSNYLFGIRRANCPSIECTKEANPDLFRKYWTSFQSMASDAKLLEWT